MRKKWNPDIRVFAGVVLIAAILSGCGSKTAGSGSAQNGGQNTEQNTMQDTTAQGNSDSQKIRKVYVAVGATFEPYTYIDENNQPAGYDVAVLQEIDNRLPQYEFQIETWSLPIFPLPWMQRRFPSDPNSLKRIRKEKRNICLLTKDLPLTTNVLYTKKEEMISIPLMIWLERK